MATKVSTRSLRVYGGLSASCVKSAVSACKQAGIIPVTLFPVGLRFLVAVGSAELYMRRSGKSKRLEWTLRPDLFSMTLKRRSKDALTRHLATVTSPPKLVELAIATPEITPPPAS